jgi:hypothetical protein
VNTKMVEEIAAAILYEGYILYPYRASAIKNQQRWTFGVIYPRAYAEKQSGADAWSMQTECLLRAPSDAAPDVRVRFLHLIERGTKDQAWQGAMEREITLDRLKLCDLASGSKINRTTFRKSENQNTLEVIVICEAELLGDSLYKLRVTIFNSGSFEGSTRDQALMQSLVSAHTILGMEGGEFVSLLEPPDELRMAVADCKNAGTWPVLVGEDGERDAMLSSPIILYDYPKIAPESPGALFDGTEIDEILTLRIMTLTDAEKKEMANADERTRQILERTESMPVEQFMKMHGILRNVPDGRGPDNL